MHSSSVLLALTIAASTASAAPLGDFDSRSLSSELGPLLKKLGLGAAAGAGVTALGDALSGSSDSSAAPASKRDATASPSIPTSLADLLMKLKLEEGHGPAAAINSTLLQRDLADLLHEVPVAEGPGPIVSNNPLVLRDIDARALSSEVTSILKKLGLGIAAGAGTTALGDALGGSDSSSAAPPSATGTSKRELEEFEARGFSSEIVPLLKKLGLGIAAGAGTTALGDAVSGSDSSSSRRDLTDFEARGLGSEIVPLLKKLGLGIAAGAGTTALGDVLGGSDSSSAAAPAVTPASRRELTDFDARSLGSALGKLLGATEDDIGTVLKNGAIGGAVTGGVVSAGDAAENAASSKRDVDIRSIGSALGKVLGATEDDIGTVLKNGAIGGAVTGGVVSAGDAIENAFGGSSSKREIDERAPLNLSPITKGILGTLTGLAASSGVEGLLDPSSKREIEERAPLNLSPITKGLLGTLTGLAASSGVEALFDPSSKRDIDEDTLNGLILPHLRIGVTSLPGFEGSATPSASRRSVDYSDVDTATLVALQKLASRALNELD